MSEVHTKLALEIEVLSPLHIGSGSNLMLGYDLVAHGGRTYRVNEDVLLENVLLKDEEGKAPELNKILMGRPASELLEEGDFEESPEGLFRYVLDGSPSKKEGEVVEQIKDVYGRLYLPGSSLKGALRTVMMWGIYKEQERKPNLDRLGRGARWAAQPLERELFGRNPNYDWLRALHVGDSAPTVADGRLALRTVRVYPTSARGGPGLDVDVEAIERGTVFDAQITLENYGFEGAGAARLRWQGKRRWIKRLPQLGLEYTRQRLLTEAKYYKEEGGPSRAMRFYDGLINRLLKLPKDTLLLQVGWGTGWESKTLGSSMLRQDDRQFEKLLRDYRMTKQRNRQVGAPFPISRNLAVVGGHPALPMGWLEVRFDGLEEIEVGEALAERAEAAPGQQTGRVAWFSTRKGYGFIKPKGGGEDIFVHISSLADPSATLHEGQRVAFDVEESEKGPRAVNAIVIS
jgi:CRISPR-associated protein Csm5